MLEELPHVFLRRLEREIPDEEFREHRCNLLPRAGPSVPLPDSPAACGALRPERPTRSDGLAD
jgi:hypothetical protein